LPTGSRRLPVRYPTVLNIVAVHNLIMTAEYGAGLNPDTGVLSPPRLLSAAWAPREAVARQDGDPVITAATFLFRSLIKNHPFCDGNKRTWVIMTQLFLCENAWTPIPGPGWLELALRVAEYAGEDTPQRIGNYPPGRIRRNLRRLVRRTKPNPDSAVWLLRRWFRRDYLGAEKPVTDLWVDDRYDIHGHLLGRDGKAKA
jgi:prophage maintenance system killer protein